MNQRLYIMRHGIAESPHTGTDHERNLTEGGRAQLLTGRERLLAHGTRFSLILHSPLVRTTQTAQLLQPLLRSPDNILPCPSLACGASPQSMLAEAKHQGAAFGVHDGILIVGHMPDVAACTLYLLKGEHNVGGYLPATMACLDFGAGALAPKSATLSWFEPVTSWPITP